MRVELSDGLRLLSHLLDVFVNMSFGLPQLKHVLGGLRGILVQDVDVDSLAKNANTHKDVQRCWSQILIFLNVLNPPIQSNRLGRRIETHNSDLRFGF